MNKALLIPIVLVMLASTVSGHGGGQTSKQQKTVRDIENVTPEKICPDPKPEWQNATEIAGVKILESNRCKPDNPDVVAAVVKGTNNVPTSVLMKTGLSESAVVKDNDRDRDGDPDDIHITLEVTGINEDDTAEVRQEIAPGIEPAFWSFSPKTRGMVHKGSKAEQLMRVPSPTLRVEKGDKVFLTVENTHYLPHTIHLHGVDHPFQSGGEGNDGVTVTSEKPIPPGGSRTYEFQPGHPGTMFYHCHVVPNVHVSMGLNGMFVIEENRSDNRVQTLNIGAGKVRHPSKTVSENYSAEYDMIYQDIDKELHQIPKRHDDTREISREINREYDVTEANSDYFLLNGKSFPYTVRESIIPVEKDSRYKLRLLNSGKTTVSLHTHGHKFGIEALDGVKLENEIQRDVISVDPAQRADITLNTTVNGLNSYGPGNWIFHDHREPGVTNDGVSPGGTISMIVYKDFIKPNGVPITNTDIRRFFDRNYYQAKIPYFEDIDPGKFGRPSKEKVELNENPSKAANTTIDMDMALRPGGMVANQDRDRLPPGCEEISGTRNVAVAAGGEYADPGEAFGYTNDSFEFNTCEKIHVTFRNNDSVRHQWMVHGLPKKVYPAGMFNIEADGHETVNGTFITPSEPQRLQIHCSLPQHEQKGMNGKIIITADDPSVKIEGIIQGLAQLVGL